MERGSTPSETESAMHADPAVAAAAKALALLDGIPINQTILKQAEAAVDASQCSELSEDEENNLCKLDRGHDGLHEWELRQAVEDREQLASALGALLDVYGHPDEAFVHAVRLILTEHGSLDARSGSY